MRATLSNGMYREVLVHSSTYFLWCKEDQKNISNFTRHYVVKEEGQTKQNKLLGGWISKRENVWADGLASRSQPEASRHLPHQPRSNAAQWLTGRARSGRRRWACTLRCKPRSCQSRILFPATERESTGEPPSAASPLGRHSQAAGQRTACSEQGFGSLGANVSNQYFTESWLSFHSSRPPLSVSGFHCTCFCEETIF